MHFDIINAKKHPKGDAAMDSQYLQIQTLLEQRAEITARLNLIPYDGSIEIKDRNGQNYVDIRKRLRGRYTSSYVG